MRPFLTSLGIIVGYVLLFLVINVVHFLFFKVDVVLYDTLLDALIALAIFAASYIALPIGWRGLSRLEVSLSFAAGLLLAGLYALSVPTVIDRSLSIYILEKLAQRGGAIRQDAFAGIFVNEYMPEHRLVDIRLTEQLASGTITVKDGCVTLTPKGRRIAEATRYFRTHVLPKRRMIMGAYTDDLTDPFRQSGAAAYGCSAPAAEPAGRP